MGALNETGFNRPTYDDLVTSQIAKAKELFGDNINTESNTPLGKFIRITCYDLAKAYEDLETCYYARFPNTASGVSLERLCAFVGIRRNPATASEYLVTFTGTVGYTIDAGFLVGTALGRTYYLSEEVTLEDGTATAIVVCTETGSTGNVAASDIVAIINPDANVESVTGVSCEVTAIDEETDSELRTRFSNTVTGSGSSTLNSIRSAILRVENVESCYIIENATSEVVDGRAAHSFEAYVLCPEIQHQAVAEAIFSKKPIGIASLGTVSKSCIAEDGTSHEIKFSLTEQVGIYVEVAISVDDVSSFDRQEEIKENLAEYINSFVNGQDVIPSALYQFVYGVGGVNEITSLSVSTDGEEYHTNRISIAKTQVARFSDVKVTVNAYVD